MINACGGRGGHHPHLTSECVSQIQSVITRSKKKRNSACFDSSSSSVGRRVALKQGKQATRVRELRALGRQSGGGHHPRRLRSGSKRRGRRQERNGGQRRL